MILMQQMMKVLEMAFAPIAVKKLIVMSVVALHKSKGY